METVDVIVLGTGAAGLTAALAAHDAGARVALYDKHDKVGGTTGLSGGVVVEDYAVIGGQVGIGDKARIESGAVLGSGCGILTSKIVRKGQVVWGTPARPLKEHLEQLANLARLPELRKEVAAIEKRLREMEGS